MSDNTQNYRRISKNSLILFFRMILLMIVSLYTSRIILKALGVEDFGIYNIVGGLVSMLAFFISSLTNATQRYLNIGLGINNKDLTIKYFKQCKTILLGFSIIVLILAETIGLWFFDTKLTIPATRLNAAFWVYQFSLISILCSINKVVYLGSIVAYEKMGVYAYLALFESFAKLLIAFSVINSRIDHLILYAGLMSMVSIIDFTLHIIYCHKTFEICKTGLYWDKSLIKEMIKFISSNIYGCFAWAAGYQGSNILMNIFFGPLVNAAKGISTQVCSITSKFTDSIMTAAKPQIIKLYASGDVAGMLNLVFKSSKLCFFITSIIAVPIIVEMEYLLGLWLGIIPDYSVIFSRITIIESLSNIFIIPLWIVANATGNIKRNQIYGRTLTLLSLPLSYFVLRIHPNAIYPVLICAIMQFMYWFYCIYDINRQLKLKVKKYISEVILPSLLQFGTLIFIGTISKAYFATNNLINLIIIIGIIAITGITISYVLLTKSEKQFIKNIVSKKKTKIL